MAVTRLLLTSLTLFVALLVLAFEFSDYARPPRTRFSSLKGNMSCHGVIRSPEEWRPPLTPDWLQDLAQDVPELVRHVCDEWVLPPSTGERRLLQPEREHYSQRGQSEFVDELLNHKTNGFFVESGAFDGEELSNSLFFEKSRNWTGLLVEPNPSSFLSLLEKRRRAYMVNACLSPKTKSLVTPFTMSELIGGLSDYMEQTHKVRIEQESNEAVPIVNVQCFPLYSILKAIGVTHIDYFSLDVEGAELEILFTLPLNQITVDVFSIEYVVTYNQQASDRKLEIIKKYLVDSHGYRIVQIGEGEDVILKKF